MQRLYENCFRLKVFVLFRSNFNLIVIIFGFYIITVYLFFCYLNLFLLNRFINSKIEQFIITWLFALNESQNIKSNKRVQVKSIIKQSPFSS